MNRGDINKCYSTRLHFALQFFFNSLCFQYVLRNKISNIWELSISLNFSLTRNNEKSNFWHWKWGVDLYTGSTYTQINMVYHSIWISCTNHSVWYCKWCIINVWVSCKWCHGIRETCTKINVHQKFYTHLISVMVYYLCKSLVD